MQKLGSWVLGQITRGSTATRAHFPRSESWVWCLPDASESLPKLVSSSRSPRTEQGTISFQAPAGSADLGEARKPLVHLCSNLRLSMVYSPVHCVLTILWSQLRLFLEAASPLCLRWAGSSFLLKPKCHVLCSYRLFKTRPCLIPIVGIGRMTSATPALLERCL